MRVTNDYRYLAFAHAVGLPKTEAAMTMAMTTATALERRLVLVDHFWTYGGRGKVLCRSSDHHLQLKATPDWYHDVYACKTIVKRTMPWMKRGSIAPPVKFRMPAIGSRNRVKVEYCVWGAQTSKYFRFVVFVV